MDSSPIYFKAEYSAPAGMLGSGTAALAVPAYVLAEPQFASGTEIIHHIVREAFEYFRRAHLQRRPSESVINSENLSVHVRFDGEQSQINLAESRDRLQRDLSLVLARGLKDTICIRFD